jgi:hypothetical protein
MSRTITSDDGGKFFTVEEIETLLAFENINITVFLTLDTINILNENALMELGEMLTAMNKD